MKINEGYFEAAFAEVIGYEGGYVNLKSDRGGETKYGISKRSYPDLNIASITLDDAKNIYFNDFWNFRTLRLGNIKNENVAIEIFDTSVNAGQGTAGRILQTALNKMNRNQRLYKDLLVDGWLGVTTLKALENILDRGEAKSLLKVLNGEQYILYSNIVKNDPTQEINFVGWMRRV